MSSRGQQKNVQLADQERNYQRTRLSGLEKQLQDRLSGADTREGKYRDDLYKRFSDFGDVNKVKDFATKPLENKEALYGYGQYQKAATGKHGLYSDEEVARQEAESQGIPASFYSSAVGDAQRAARVSGDSLGLDAGSRAMTRDAARAATSGRTEALNRISRDVAGQRQWGAAGGTGASTTENNLTNQRFLESMGLAGNLENQKNAGLMGLYSTPGGESSQLLQELMNSYGLDAQTAAQLLGIRVGATPEPWWKTVLSAGAAAAPAFFSPGQSKSGQVTTMPAGKNYNPAVYHP